MANPLARRIRLRTGLAPQVQPSSTDPLAISGLRVWPLREPVSGRSYTVVRIETRSGLRGYGECGPVDARSVSAARAALSGLAASAFEVAWLRLGDASPLRAAVNMAQLDVLGRHTNAPVFQVLGGPTRFKCRALAPLDGPAALERAQNAGFRAFAFPLPTPPWRNAGKAYVQKVAQLTGMMRRAAGETADFVLDGAGADGHGKLVPGDAQSIAAEVEPAHLLWFDEPCRLLSLGAVRKISDESVTPLGFGRTLGDAADFHNLLRDECADILRPSLAHFGVSPIRKIAALAEQCYTAVAPYHNGGPVATAAALHLAASIPNFFIQQIPTPVDARDIDFRKSIAGDALEKVDAGFLALPTGAGLGIRINESALDKQEASA